MENLDYKKTIMRVSRNSVVWNLVLSVIKLIAGIIANSSAMVSDAVHSASDVFSSIIVMIGAKLSTKESDDDHQYGHERIESVASIVLALVLCITGVFIGHTAIEVIASGSYTEMKVPGILAMIAAIVSIISKEAMFLYTKHYAKSIESTSLMADAWHHRSDALSSIGSLIGIVGTRLGVLWLDQVASLVICAFIIKAAFDIFAESIRKMTDHSCDEATQNEMVECAKNINGVTSVKNIKTRVFGNKIYVDMEVCADGNITLFQSNSIGKEVHDAIEHKFPKVKHIVVLVTPQNVENH